MFSRHKLERATSMEFTNVESYWSGWQCFLASLMDASVSRDDLFRALSGTRRVGIRTESGML